MEHIGVEHSNTWLFDTIDALHNEMWDPSGAYRHKILQFVKDTRIFYAIGALNNEMWNSNNAYRHQIFNLSTHFTVVVYTVMRRINLIEIFLSSVMVNLEKRPGRR